MRRREVLLAFLVGLLAAIAVLITQHGFIRAFPGVLVPMAYEYWFIGIGALLVGIVLTVRSVAGPVARWTGVIGAGWVGFMAGSFALLFVSFVLSPLAP